MAVYLKNALSSKEYGTYLFFSDVTELKYDFMTESFKKVQNL